MGRKRSRFNANDATVAENINIQEVEETNTPIEVIVLNENDQVMDCTPSEVEQIESVEIPAEPQLETTEPSPEELGEVELTKVEESAPIPNLEESPAEGKGDEPDQPQDKESAPIPNLEESPAIEEIGLTIKLPIETVNVPNLIALLAAKGDLLMEALGIGHVEFDIDNADGTIAFPWFLTKLDSKRCEVYTDFVARIAKFTMERKRITSQARELDNKKYAFRCFLLRLGYVGEEYKLHRKVLLEKLKGSSAFKCGFRKPKEENANDLCE